MSRFSNLLGPVALASGIILADFALYGTPVLAAVRSLVVIVGLAVLAYTLLLLITRHAPLAALLTSAGVLVSWGSPETIMAAVIGGVGVAGSYAIWRGSLADAAAAVRVVCLLFAGLGLVSLAMNGGFRHLVPQPSLAESATGPPMYIIVLDGYPGLGTLRNWGYDNEPFLAELEDRGFDVARDSTSNYASTQHTFVSMLYMRHVPEIAELSEAPADHRARVRLLSHIIADGGPALTLLREHGYQVFTVPSIVGDVTIWGAMSLGSNHVNDFEIHLLNDTVLGRALYRMTADWLADAHRRSVTDAFSTLVSEQSAGRFVWVHVMSPHRPYVFGPQGEARPLPACFPDCGYWEQPANQTEALIDQAQYLNVLVLDAIDRIDAAAVVVVMSDHGMEVLEPAEQFRNVMAVRAPGHPELLPDDATAISLFPRLFNAYFDVGLSLPPDRHYRSEPGTRLEFEPWP